MSQITVAAALPSPDNAGLTVASMPRLGAGAGGSGFTPEAEETMTNQNDPNSEKNDMRIMWIASAVIVALILGAMGINMLVTHDTTGSIQTSSQSGAVPPK
jgi:hypothetical protein